MQFLASSLSSLGSSAAHFGGLGLLVSSVASVLIVSVVHISSTRGEAYDEAILGALEEEKASRLAAPKPAGKIYPFPVPPAATNPKTGLAKPAQRKRSAR